MLRNLRVFLTLAGLAGLVPVLLSQAPATPKRYAVVIGIDEYQAKQLGSLRYAARDATALADVLESADYSVTRLISGKTEPTRASIDAALKKVLEGARKGDLVVVAFAGHGIQFVGEEDSYFCPSDARPDVERKESLLSVKTLYRRLSDSFGTCVVLADACRNDPNVRAAGKARNGVNGGVEVPEGVAALYSCKAGEFAFENDDRKHGVFFYHALERMRKAASDGEELSFNALAEHVQVAVPKEASQTPVTRVNTGRVVLVPLGKSGLEKTFTNSVGMEFVLVPAGEFLMGSPEGEKDREKNEGPQRKVKISAFYCGKYEVTRGQFAAFVKATGYQTDQEKRTKYKIGDTEYEDGWGWDAEKKELRRDAQFSWKNVGFAQTDAHPVVLVSHNDAVAYVAWLNSKEQRKGKYGLLREAEFEYANRAGTQKVYAHGDDAEELAKYGNVADGTAKKQFSGWRTIQSEDGYVFTAPVGRFRANGFGLHDLTGNVREWCEDWYDEQYYDRGENTNPKGSLNGASRVLRGGSFDDVSRVCRAAFRNRLDPAGRHFGFGFRVCFRPD